MISYEAVQTSYLSFDGALPLTKDRNMGVKSRCLFWRRVLERKEERKLRRDLNTRQIRHRGPDYVTLTVEPRQFCVESIQESRWLSFRS